MCHDGHLIGQTIKIFSVQQQTKRRKLLQPGQIEDLHLSEAIWTTAFPKLEKKLE